MAKRELIDKNSIELVSLEDSLRYMEWHKDSEVELGIKATVITEEEIVKPYLEKLSKEISEVYEDDEYDGYDPNALVQFEERVQELIDNLLTEKGAEE